MAVLYVLASRLACDLLDESFHRHSLGDKARSGLIHLLKQAPPCSIDTRNVSQVDFQTPVGYRRLTPRVFGFGDPGASELA